MIGSLAQVFHGTADQTAGGLKKKDLILDNGEIKSKAAQQAALARMKKEGKKHLVKVFKPTKKGFKLQPKEGTKAYKTKVAKMA
jgi:hypothetical protein